MVPRSYENLIIDCYHFEIFEIRFDILLARIAESIEKFLALICLINSLHSKYNGVFFV